MTAWDPIHSSSYDNVITRAMTLRVIFLCLAGAIHLRTVFLIASSVYTSWLRQRCATCLAKLIAPLD